MSTGKAFALFAALAACPFAHGAELLSLKAPVDRWEDAIPLGNGGAGALLWGGGDTLNVTLDRADFWHNVENPSLRDPAFTWSNLVDTVKCDDPERRKEIFETKTSGMDSMKLPGVRLVMKLAAGHTLRHFSLDAETGAATVTVSTADGDRDVLAWFDDGDAFLSMRVPDDVTFTDKSFVKNKSFDRLSGYPEPEVVTNGNALVYRRPRRHGADNRFDTDFAAGVRFRNSVDAPDSAFWRAFNSESSVKVPDSEVQRFYDFAIYLYGAGARPGFAPIALQGLWTADNGDLPPWNGDYHNDMNTEMTYWAAGPSGHIAALEGFMDFLIERLPEFRRYCAALSGGGRGAAIPGVMGIDGGYLTGWAPFHIPPINGIWAFITVCDAWDYDPAGGKAERLLAFGRELAEGLENFWTEENGVRRFGVSCSPEVGNNSKAAFLPANTTYDRAIAISFYRWLSRLAKACGHEEESKKWLGYADAFGPPNVTKDGVLELAPSVPPASTHRHPSQLIQVFPLANFPVEAGVDLAKSVERWEKFGTDRWVGFSFPWAACFEARLGRGDRALAYLKDFARAFTSRNGFNLNGDQLRCGLSKYTYKPFTLEANFGFARAVQEMLLSYNCATDTYRIFPSLPEEWDGKEVSFTNLRIPGGHRVSARRLPDGTVTHVFTPYPGSSRRPKFDCHCPRRMFHRTR